MAQLLWFFKGGGGSIFIHRYRYDVDRYVRPLLMKEKTNFTLSAIFPWYTHTTTTICTTPQLHTNKESLRRQLVIRNCLLREEKKIRSFSFPLFFSFSLYTYRSLMYWLCLLCLYYSLSLEWKLTTTAGPTKYRTHPEPTAAPYRISIGLSPPPHLDEAIKQGRML